MPWSSPSLSDSSSSSSSYCLVLSSMDSTTEVGAGSGGLFLNCVAIISKPANFSSSFAPLRSVRQEGEISS